MTWLSAIRRMFRSRGGRLAAGLWLTADLLLAAGLPLVLGGCTSVKAPILIGVNGWPPCEIWYVAEQQGYFGKVPVKIVRFSIWSDNMASLYKGNLDLTHATYLNALYYGDKGEKARIVLSSDTILGGDGLVLKSSLAGIEELRGKRVAVEVNTDEHFLLRKALEAFGLTEQDITLISTTSERAATLFGEGAVEACFTYEPFLSEAAARGGGRIAWSTKELPGYMTDVLVATEKAIANRHRDLQVILAAWYKAQDYIRLHPAEAFALMAEKEGMSAEDFAAFYNSFTMFSPQENVEIFDSAAFRTILSEMNDFLLFHRAVRAPLDVGQAFTADFARKVAKLR